MVDIYDHDVKEEAGNYDGLFSSSFCLAPPPSLVSLWAFSVAGSNERGRSSTATESNQWSQFLAPLTAPSWSQRKSAPGVGCGCSVLASLFACHL